MSKVNVDQAIDFVQASGDAILSALALSAAGRMDTEQTLGIIKAHRVFTERGKHAIMGE